MTAMMIDQSQLRAALLDPTQAVPAGLTDGAGMPTQKRFDVYRNNVTVALRDAMTHWVSGFVQTAWRSGI